MKHILAPTDFSAPSRKALGYAKQLAAVLGAKVTLLHVIERVVLPDAAALLTMPDDQAAAQMNADLDALKAEVGLPDAAVVIRRGTPFHEIALAAQELNADMVVLATHGYTGLKHVVLGSTAERVVRHTHCPVLVVPARD
jgi:universal stress protein A